MASNPLSLDTQPCRSATAPWAARAPSASSASLHSMQPETVRPHAGPGSGFPATEWPPSEVRICPLIHAASADRRNETRAAASSGRPGRPSGVRDAASSSISGLIQPVWLGPGLIAVDSDPPGPQLGRRRICAPFERSLARCVRDSA